MHLDAVSESHLAATEFKPHTASEAADVMQEPKSVGQLLKHVTYKLFTTNIVCMFYLMVPNL